MSWLTIQLCGFAFLAGFIDSVVGGGGLIQLPALLLLLPPTRALVRRRMVRAAERQAPVLRTARMRGGGGVSALLLAPAFGRWTLCYGLCTYPSARPDGLGVMAQAQSTPSTLRNATILAAIAAISIAGLRGTMALALVWLVARTLARWWTRDLGGLTGDTYGALCELGEVVALAALTAWR